MSFMHDVSDISTRNLQGHSRAGGIDVNSLAQQIEHQVLRKVSAQVNAERNAEAKIGSLQNVGEYARIKTAEAIHHISRVYFTLGKLAAGGVKTSAAHGEYARLKKQAEEMAEAIADAAGEGAMNEAVVIEALVDAAAANPEIAAALIADETGNDDVTPEEVEGAAQAMAADQLGAGDEDVKTASAYGKAAVDHYRNNGFHRAAQILVKSAEVRAYIFQQQMMEG